MRVDQLSFSVLILIPLLVIAGRSSTCIDKEKVYDVYVVAAP